MWRLLAGRLMVVVGLVVGGLGLVGGVGVSAQTVADVAVRDRLIADQEALLNTYRCMFGVDVEVVPGGCSGGAPVLPAEDPDPFSGDPTASEIAVRDQLVADQEALLNVYRCMFGIDTGLVPGGCPEIEVEEEVDPPEEVETEPEPEVEEHPCAEVLDVGPNSFPHMAEVDKVLNLLTLQFCCPNNALHIDRNGRCFGDKGYEPHSGYFAGCSGGWVRDVNSRCPGEEDYGAIKCIGGAIELIYNICPSDYGYGYYGYGYDYIGHNYKAYLGDTGVPWLKCSGGVIMDAYGRCPGDEFYYGEQQCPDGGSVIDYYGRCPSDNDYGMGWKE